MNTENTSDGFVEWQGTRYKTILPTAATGGAISIVDSVSPPESGPPRHVHQDADETFVVLSGDVTFWMEGETVNVGPGGTIFVPRGKEHTFRVSSHGPSRHLVILTPGGFEGFFDEMAEGQFAIPQDMDKIVAVAERYQLAFTGPPLDAQD